MSVDRRTRLDQLHQKVQQMANARWYNLHRHLAEVIRFADDIPPTTARWSKGLRDQEPK